MQSAREQAAAESPAVRAARALADGLLRPAAERVDAEGVPRSHLDALGAAGLLAPLPPSVQREVAELLAGADGSTWFVWAQHATPRDTVARSPLAGRVDLVSGRTLAAVAFSHLRRQGPPAVRAARVRGGWRFDGRAPWTTSWGLADVLLLCGLSSDDEVVAALVPARPAPGLTATPPLRLAAVQAASTVGLELSGLVVGDDSVAEVVPGEQWRAADRLRTVNAGPHTFGLLREVVRRLAEPAPAAAAALAGEAEGLRRRAYALLDEVPADQRLDERLVLRASATALAVRAAAALVAAGGGRAMGLDAAPQRLAREALFGLVQAQTPDGREAQLRELAGGRD